MSCDSQAADCCKPDPWINIGGQYRVMYNASNFDYHSVTLDNNQQSQTFFNQRFRTWLEINPNDNVQGYLQVEMGHVGWGSNFDFPKTYNGPRWPAAVDGDRVGIELRRGWLSYKNEGLGRLRAGIQGWQDSFGQTLASSDWDFDVGGLSWLRTFPAFGDMTMLLGMFSLNEANVHSADDATLFTLDLDWCCSKDSSFGFSTYYLPDSGGDQVLGPGLPNNGYSYPQAAPYASAWDVWIGVRARTKLMRVPINAFVIYNPGERKELGGAPTFKHWGTGLKLEAGPIAIGPGELSFQTLYSTGDANPGDNSSNEFRTVAQSERDNFGAQGYWSYLVITSADGPSDVNDLGVSLQNRGFGLFTVQANYAYPIYQALSGRIATGWLRSATTNPTSGATEMGTELANVFTLDFGGGLIADFGASVLFTGDFYKTSPAAPRPDNLYEAFTRLQLEF